MRSRMKRSTISTRPSFDMNITLFQQRNPQDKKLQSFLLRKGSINTPNNPPIENDVKSIKSTSKEKKQKQKLSKDEFIKNNIPFRGEFKQNFYNFKSMQQMQHEEIQQKYKRDPFMKAKIQAFVRQNSATKRHFNTYRDYSSHKTPVSLKEKIDKNDFQFYTKYAKIRQQMGFK